MIVLEPKEERKQREDGADDVYNYYYLLTAYKLEGKDEKRNKIESLYTKRNNVLL